MKLNDQRTIITGATQGLGLEIAKNFIKEGAHVAICGRDKKMLAKAHRELASLASTENQIFSMAADVSKPTDIENFVQTSLMKLGRIDILVTNAAIYGPKGSIEENSWEEWVDTINTNLYGTVFTCRALVPHFKKNNYGKILLLSGGGATKPLPHLSAYATSKAAVVRFGETLAEELRDFNITVNAIAPGALNTRLLDEIIAAGSEKVGKTFYQQALKQQASGGTSLELGARLCVFLASRAADNITGKLISAEWDPWPTLSSHAAELKESDIYTLRRIIPSDRGKQWE